MKFETRHDVMEYMERQIGICDMDGNKNIVVDKETFINIYLTLKGA